MISYLLEVLASSFIFWLIYKTLLHKDTFFERNRIYLLAATLLSLLLPLANWQNFFTLSEGTQVLGMASSTLLQEIQIGTKTLSNVEPNSWLSLLPYLALLVSLAYLAYAIFGVIRLINLAQLSPKQSFKEYILVKVEKNQYPFSFLNYLFWGNNLSLTEAEEQKIIQHELAHIKGKHSYDIILMELVCTVFWLNPFFFLFKKYLKEQHEYIADASVYRQGEKSNYARLMVQNTLKSLDLGSGFLPNTSIQLSHNFYQSPIIKRLEMMNKQRTPIVKNVKLLAIIPAIALLGFLYSCNSVESTETIVEDLVKKSDDDAMLVKKEKIGEDETYEIVAHSAEPVGGYQVFYKYVAENLKYPEQAQRLGVQGKVYVQFVVEKDGTLTEAKVVRGIGAGCDKAALDIITNSDKWTSPINKDGEFVKQRIVLPINFKLD